MLKMSKITLMIFVVMFVFCFSSSQATFWAEKQETYQFQPNYCGDFEKVNAEFDWDSYGYVTEKGDADDFEKLFLEYDKKITEYIIFGDEIGILYYKNMIISLKLVYSNRFGYPSVESNEYKILKIEADNLSERINEKISRCNYHWE